MINYNPYGTPEEKTRDVLRLKQALQKFRKAAYEVEDAWDSYILPYEAYEIGGSEEIPFTASFDEWLYILDNWIDAACEDLDAICG